MSNPPSEPSDEGHEFAAWLRAALDRADIKKRALAKRLAPVWGIDVETVRRSIYRWLEGRDGPTHQRRVEIGEALGVPYPPPKDQTLAGRLEGLEGALLELVRDGADFRGEVIARLERLEQLSGTAGHPSTARTAP